uniref:Uncharacterized protein n=1 Tax=Candidatus Kentrum sp. SD TaxID=2126332 RepID=A0A451BIT6_9GAMM|nr:MAG: hypothetical protein BECKSD772D_GA0070982_100922 [Candidatus Kentron sp. SD]
MVDALSLIHLSTSYRFPEISFFRYMGPAGLKRLSLSGASARLHDHSTIFSLNIMKWHFAGSWAKNQWGKSKGAFDAPSPTRTGRKQKFLFEHFPVISSTARNPVLRWRSQRWRGRLACILGTTFHVDYPCTLQISEDHAGEALLRKAMRARRLRYSGKLSYAGKALALLTTRMAMSAWMRLRRPSS